MQCRVVNVCCYRVVDSAAYSVWPEQTALGVEAAVLWLWLFVCSIRLVSQSVERTYLYPTLP